MLELLAPAGDLKSFDAAIRCGADAVYLGLKNFNARMKADNFGGDSLRDAVKRAHFFGVKVYVTLNTLAQNDEMARVLEAAKEAIEAKVDAFIVQDVGVVAMLREAFENVEIHASTQMGVHNLFGAKVLERMGVKRAVLSRETTLADICEIRQNTALELEYFVQGALCVSFSGGCYLSSVEQGASGNRGLCKQLCRLPYTAALGDKKKTGYLLSARDFCLADSVAELAEAGVTSFKIEGRMRREGYVAQTVRIYRDILDGTQHRLSNGELFALKAAFSRGEYLSRGYLDGGTPSVIEPRFNNHAGIRIGEVIEVKPFKKELFEVSVRSSRPLNDGDGIKLFDKDVEKASLGMGGVRQKCKDVFVFVTSTPVKAGWKVNLTLDSAAERSAIETPRYNGITMRVTALKDRPLKIEAAYSPKDGDVISAEKEGLPPEDAKSAPMSEDMIREQATKTQYAGFVVENCSVLTDGVFIPKSTLNALRRDVIEELKIKIENARERKTDIVMGYSLPKFEGAACDGKLRVVTSEEAASGIFLREGELVALAPAEYTSRRVNEMLSLLDLTADEVALKLPALSSGEDIAVIEKLLKELPQIKTLVANCISGLHFATFGYNVIAGEGMNIANDLAAREAARLGACAVVPSLEFKDGISSKAGVKVYRSCSQYPLMTFAHCPYKTLFDNDCAHCSFKPGLTLARENKTYAVRRVKLARCQFELYPKKK